MQKISIKASKNYDVCIGSGLLDRLSEIAEFKTGGRNVMLVTDDKVESLYGNRLCGVLENNSKSVQSFVFPNGEHSKTLFTYRDLVEKMCALPMSRSDLVIALGGGVVGDLAGFAAATYQRGIDFVQIPTTLLAAVDSSVGGKTGVDLDGGKNQIGAFYQPVQVVCDTDALKTLPSEEYQNGCAEIIKYAMIGNEKLFRDIGEVSVSERYEDVIATCVYMKRDIVEKDEYDTGIRALLNFGHTIGHAVEKCSNYDIPHGKAVAIGMAVITKAAVRLGHCGQKVYEELVQLLQKYGLPQNTDFSQELLAEAMMADKKSRGDTITLIVPQEIGKCVPVEVKKTEIPKWLKEGMVG